SPYHGSRATPSPKSPRTGFPAQRAGPGAKPCATRDIAAARRSALAHLVARVGLVDDVHAPLAPHQTTVLVAVLDAAQRVLDLHHSAPAGFLRRKLEKRRLNLSTWPPRSTTRERSPVHAGCTLGSMSRVSVAPGSP